MTVSVQEQKYPWIGVYAHPPPNQVAEFSATFLPLIQW